MPRWARNGLRPATLERGPSDIAHLQEIGKSSKVSPAGPLWGGSTNASFDLSLPRIVFDKRPQVAIPIDDAIKITVRSVRRLYRHLPRESVQEAIEIEHGEGRPPDLASAKFGTLSVLWSGASSPHATSPSGRPAQRYFETLPEWKPFCKRGLTGSINSGYNSLREFTRCDEICCEHPFCFSVCSSTRLLTDSELRNSIPLVRVRTMSLPQPSAARKSPLNIAVHL